MTTYITFYEDEPKYKITAEFYEIEDGFVFFYDTEDNVIVSINAAEIDFILDKKYQNQFGILERIREDEIEDDEENEDEEIEEENEDEEENNKSKYIATFTIKPTNKDKFDDEFNILLKKLITHE